VDGGGEGRRQVWAQPNPTAQALRLDYHALKKHFEAVGNQPDGGVVATFVELAPPAAGSARECILELEDPGGAKMRVHRVLAVSLQPAR